MGERRTTIREIALGVLAVAVGVLWTLAWRFIGGRDPLGTYGAEGAAGIAPWESDFYLAAGVVEGVLIAAISVRWTSRWTRSLDSKFRELWARPAAAYVALGAGGAAFSFFVAATAIRFHTITEDEKTYLLQAKLLLSGHLTFSPPADARAFWQPFIVESHGRWSGQYFWAQPALLAVGQAIGLPWLIPPLEVAVTVFFTGRLAEEYTGDRRAGVLAAVLAATSPLLVLTGGTLHNASLAAACSAASLWGLARLVRVPSTGAAITLGLSTGIALHNRVLDHATLLTGAGVVALIAQRRSIVAFVRRLLPAVAVGAPFVALHLLINWAVSGDVRRSGYYLFNDGHGWTTMGFGSGPFGFPHSPSIAATKTFTVLTRVAFFTTGSPFLLLLPAAQVVGFVRGGARALVPLAPVVGYLIAYFFYAASSIYATGPVYYDALVPVFSGWIAFAAVELHTVLRDGAHRRLVPAFAAAQSVAAGLVFYPPQLLEASRTSADSSRCDSLVAAHQIDNAVVFVNINGHTPLLSWTNWPPMPSPDFSDAVLYPRVGKREQNLAVVRQFGKGRRTFMAKCIGGDPWIAAFDPDTGTLRELAPGSPEPKPDGAPPDGARRETSRTEGMSDTPTRAKGDGGT